MYITQGLKRAVQVNGNGMATIDGNRKRTWIEFAERVAKLAGAFKGLGLSEEGRVAMLAFNSDRYLEFFYAVPWAGGVVVPLNIRLAPPELIDILNDSGAEILIVDDTFQAMLPAFGGNLSTIKHIVFTGEGATPEGTLNYEEILAPADAVPDATRNGDDLAGLLYISGSDGQPLGVMLTHDNFVSSALNRLSNSYAGEPEVYLHAAPMFHIADCSMICTTTLAAATHAFIPKFDLEGIIKAIQAYGVTQCVLVPTMINMLLNFPGIENYDLSSLKTIFYGGSPIPEEVLSQAMAAFPACEFVQGYGMTQTTAGDTSLEAQFHTLEGPLAGKFKSVGRPNFSVELKIVDPNDKEVQPGTIGEIITRGPHLMKGFWNKPEETAQALRGGWMHTGDAGYMDADGFVYLVGRVQGMIITGGENVYPAEVEKVIAQHPAVSMCAVIGIPSDKWGEAVHAVITLNEDQTVTEEEIIKHCKGKIAGYKCPRSIDIRREPLPMGPEGRINKDELRAPFWQGKERQVN